ncbi:sodium:solute symporter family protein [Siminovitchia sp. 179-K 8D1 HS]|uniref:sodium:solute symporter family protein n=1 Tax=Siminovitchia sp. 179-K 8D1 HS TaxID=3142385 RepID=UPI0039A07948
MAISIHIVVIIIYAVLMVLLALYYNKREVTSGDDFIIAGHRLPLIVVIGTLTASWVGSGSLVGGASFVYQYGPLAAIFYFLGGPLGIIVMYFLAAKTRTLAKRTVPEMLEVRFGKTARLCSTIFILLTYLSVLSYQFISGGYVLNITTGIPEHIGSLLTVIFVIVLAATGGLFSVSYTDMFSALLIIFGFFLAVPFILIEVGGFSNLAANLPDSKFTWNGGLTPLQLVGYFLPLFIYIIGDQSMLQRFSASKTEQTARRSTIGFFIGVVTIYTLITFFVTTAIVLLPNIKPDTALIQIANNNLPVSVGALILAAFTALLITTANSFLLSMSGNIVYDLYERFKGKLPENKYLKFNRITVIAIGVFAYLMALFFTSVLKLSIFAYTMYAAAITPVILASFFWKKATTQGAVASILTGGCSTILIEITGNPIGGNTILLSLPLSVIALVCISLFTQNTTQPVPLDTTQVK